MNAAGGNVSEALLPPGDEPERLDAVRRYDVLDTPADGAFDRITALAARHFGVPIAIVSIVDSDRIWFKSHHGLDVGEIGRDPGLCASAILQHDPWIVEDAAIDPRTLSNPLVAGEFGLRFYAGVPLTTHDGFNLGTLCVIDREPRRLSEDEGRTLRDLAAIVMSEMEMRLASRRAVQDEQRLRDEAERTARALQQSLLPPQLPAIPGAELAALYQPASASVVGGDFYDAFQIADGEWALVIGDVSGKGAEAAAVTGLARHTIRTAFLASKTPAQVMAMLNGAMFLGLGSDLPAHFCTVLMAVVRPRPEAIELTLARAGHPPPLVRRADGSIEELPAGEGPPVGWQPGASFAAASAGLGTGDVLVFYTDGLSEARVPGGFLGVEGVMEALQGGGAAPLLSERLARGLTAEGVEVRDDAAALLMSVGGA